MKTVIFYFSATGNTLSVARSLAATIEDCELVSMADAVTGEHVAVEADRIGLLFPVFAWGMPRLVGEFAAKLRAAGSPYVFAVATCVAIPGLALKDIQKVLKKQGLVLKAGFAVRTHRSSLMKMNLFDKIIISLDRQRKKIRRAEDRLGEISTVIGRLGIHRPETSSPAANLIGALLHDLAVESFKKASDAFVVKDSCTGCGTCVRVCPRGNISLGDGRPTFSHDCELCHACIQWCPTFSIRHPGFDQTLQPSRHPEVLVADLARGRYTACC